MKTSAVSIICMIMVFYFTGFTGRMTAQGIRNEGATINIASGYVLCQGGLANNGGTVYNNGTMTLSDAVTNQASGVIQGNGNFIIGGNLLNNGTFTLAAGTTTINGTGAQTISGSSETTFSNLVIEAASAGTTIAAGARVTVAGSTFSPNGKLTINSDAVNNSGSLIYSGSGTPSGNVAYNRVMPASLYRYISSPVGSASLPSGRTYWLWDEPSGAWVETTSCSSGLGYTMLTDGGTVSFTGTVVTTAGQTGTAPYTTPYIQNRTDWGGGGWNLLGNPFTSAMNASVFISSNTASLDPSYLAVYIYNGDDYYYIAAGVPGYEGLGTFSSGATAVQAGQGFFVLANYNNVPFSFINTMQTHNTSVPMTKSAVAEENPWPGLQLRLQHGEKENSTLVVYNEEMTAGLDPGYDVGQMSEGAEVDIYTTLVEKDNSVNFARQALPATNCEKNIIPVGIDTEKGGQVIFSAFTVPLGDKKFWLEDRGTGIFTNLNSNTYTVALPEKTYGTGRFYIIASVNTPTAIDSPAEEDLQNLRIWSYDGKVIIKGMVSGKAVCEIYDAGGRKIVMHNLKDGEINTVTMPSTPGGVYLVRVVNGSEVTTGKVVFP